MDTNRLKQNLARIIAEKAGLSVDEVTAMFESPKQKEHGDLAFPCFKLAKTMRKAPPAIAAELNQELFGESLPKGVASVEQVSGYLNITFETGDLVGSILNRVLTEGERFGSSTEGNGKKIVLEFSSVNIAKPFGIAHLRSTIIGATLTRIYDKLGYETIAINHLGDWGTQFGKLIAAYRIWGDEYQFSDDAIQDMYKIYVRFHQAAESDNSLEDRGREEFRKLELGDPENVALWKKFCELSMCDYERVYDLLNVKFDYQTGESFYQDKMENVVEELRSKNLLKTSEGAQVVDLEPYQMPPCLIKKSDDATLYITRDLAALLYRKETYDFDKILYVVNVAQQLHFKQLFKVVELMGKDWVGNVVHVDFGWVLFGDQMMSTREGTLIFFDDVYRKAKSLAVEIVVRENPDMPNVEETAGHVAIAAIVFTQLKVKRVKDVHFDWAEALSFKGETGPYLQYTYARLTSLIAKYGKKLPDLDADFGLLGDEEKEVIKWFELYQEKLRQAAESYQTSILTDFLLSLAATMNSYWQRIRILTDNKELTCARMQMAYAVRLVIADGLKLLGITPLERM